MRLRQTHTVAELEVSDATYNEILGYLVLAGYQHAIDITGMIDMSGIGLVRAASHALHEPGDTGQADGDDVRAEA